MILQIRQPGRRSLVTGAVAVAIAVALRVPTAGADPARDTLPFRIAFGRPHFTTGDETACYLWIQGGRLRVRITADKLPHRVAGELRTSQDGLFEDVMPLSENLRIRQPRPGRLLFDARPVHAEEGFDVTLGGDFGHVTVDLLVDGERRPRMLRIGERRRSPAALPARLELRIADSTWIERFGF